jgi:thiamine biosynthesis protein ThiS
MHIFINGERTSVAATTLEQLVIELGFQGKRIAVEMDGQLITKSKHAVTLLSDDAKIEIIHAVGGG